MWVGHGGKGQGGDKGRRCGERSAEDTVGGKCYACGVEHGRVGMGETEGAAGREH